MHQKSDSGPPQRQRRVVVRVDTQSHLPSVIELAAAIAAATESMLHGVFVKDLDLLSVAALPFSQEVLLAGGKSRSLDNQQLVRSLDKIAHKFRQAVEQQARLSALSCSHAVVRGHTHNIGLGEVGELEFLVLGRPSRGRTQPRGPLRILLLAEPDGSLLSVLRVILGIKPELRAELLLLSDSTQRLEELAPALAQLLAAYPQVMPSTLPSTQLQALLVARSPRIDYVLTSRQAVQGLLGNILRLAGCPVVVAAGAA